jgi:hypothetical protein
MSRSRGGACAGAGVAGSPALALALLCALAAVALCAPMPVMADVFGPISLVSGGLASGASEAQQAEYAHDTAISGNGRYVAFDGSFHGVSGVWRAEVQGAHVVGEIEQVAGGDAELPSISETGQYVSFTTNEGKSLAEITDGKPHEPKPEAANVYVRDMSKTKLAEEPGAFIIASAPSGTGEPLTYIEPEATHGSVAAGRSAISANGNEVAFVTTAVSNLVNPSEVNTPALEVAVRFLETNETVLVSRCYFRCEGALAPSVPAREGEPAFGAVYPGGSSVFAPAPAYGDFGTSPPAGASISADGSTVAWMGSDINQQSAMLTQEQEHIPPHYIEPLWRRITNGETATERVTGGSDPAAPGCAASGETVLPSHPSSTDPCQGPFEVEEEKPSSGIWASGGGDEGDFLPRLSKDGYTVAFLSEAPLVSLGENFGTSKTGQESDLYVADMHAGLTRDQALTQLTELAGGGEASLADVAPIYDFEISPNASQVAFSTRRTQFPLGSPALVSPLAGEPGMNELFDVDLTNHTLTRVSHGYQGPDEPSEHPHPPKPAGEDPYEQRGDGALSPSFSTEGTVLAFSSTASNLAFGDGNAPPAGPLDGSDAFLIERTIFQAQPTPRELSPAPETATEPAWQLGMTALSRSDGSVVLYVRAPAAGTLRVGAKSWIEVRAAGHRPRKTVALRTVASASRVAQAAAGELIVLPLRLAKPYAALATQRGGLSANVSATFAAPGEQTLRQSAAVSFTRTTKPARRSVKALARRGSRKAGRRR